MRGFAVASLVTGLAACSSDSGLKKYNSDPEVSISSHTTGDTVVEGVAEIVRGQVGDPNHAIADLSVTWLMNGAETCEDSAPDEEGVVSCEMTFGTDGAEVSLEVRDPEGAGASASVTLEVQPTDAPVAEITAPSADGVYYSDQLITFQGTVSDTEDAIDALTVAFETAALGDLELDLDVTSEGAVEAFGSLEEGEHAVKLRVTDTTGKEGVDSVVITVGPPNSAPTCAITAPETGSAGPEGELVTFTGTAGDVDVAADWLAVEWSSDKDGPIGSSTPTTAGDIVFNYGDLSVDTHTITMTVTDEIGATCSDLTVFTVGTPPVLTVTAPADGATLNHNDAVVFEATVEDNEDLPNEVSLSWESDLDGVFSTDGADSSGAATVSVATLSPGDHVVTVTATDTDGLFVTDTVSFNLNQPPTTPTVTLEPDPAVTNQMLVATASGSEDPEGTGTVTYAYEWFEDGVATAESASATFPASATGKNHTYRVQVTASDGLVESAFGFAEVNVINSAPALAGPSLSTATAIVGDVLTCSATATDLDPEDSPIVSYAWSDGSTGPSYTVTMADAVDSTITCTATADDADGGVTTGTASATVTNTAPTIDTVTVSPATGQVGHVLTCTATATDADGTTPDITYAWSDGTTGGSYTITASDSVGSTITCTATATDAYDATGTGTASATVTNTAPVMGTVSITPEDPNNDNTLTCSASATDADTEVVTVTYTWSTGATGAMAALTSATSPGETITCTATATDESGASDFGTASVTVVNRLPTAGTVTITPDAPAAGDALTCAAPTAGDPDGDDLTLGYAWDIGGADAGTGASLSSVIAKGDTVTCTVTATDPSGGTGTASASVTVGNTGPAVSSVTLTPSSLYTNDTVTAMATTTDADGDVLTLTYAFSVDGSVVQDGAASTLDGAEHFDKGQVVTVTVTANDGTATGSGASGGVTVLNSPPTAPAVTISETEECSSVYFDSDDDLIQVGSLGGFEWPETFTWEAWLKWDPSLGSGKPEVVAAGDIHSGSSSRGVAVLSLAWGSDPWHFACDTSPVWSGGFHGLVSDATGYWSYCPKSGTMVATDEWIHLALVVDTDTARLFYNGALVGTRGVSSIRRSDATPLTIGSGYGGTIGSVRLSSVARYTADFSAASLANDADTVALWRFAEGAGSIAEDSSGNGHTGTITGATWVEDCPAETPENMVCDVVTESVDADGDAVSYTFDWDVDGTPFIDSITTHYTGDTVDSDDIGSDETWTCSVTPDDGEDMGASAEDTISTARCLSSVPCPFATGTYRTPEDWAGIENCSSIPGSVHFNDRTETELPNNCLEAVGGDVEIVDSGSVENLDQLSRLRTVGGHLLIWNNDSLTTLQLDELNAVGGFLDIDNNDAISSFELNTLETVGAYVDVDVNSTLTTFSMAELRSVGGDFIMRENAVLTTFSMDSLTSITGELWITLNFDLCSTVVNALRARLSASGSTGSYDVEHTDSGC